MHLFNSAAKQPETQTSPAWWFILRGHRLLTEGSAVPTALTLADLGLTAEHTLYLGQFKGRDCYATAVADETEPPKGMAFYSLRRLLGQLDNDQARIAGRALQMMAWLRNNQFCGRCATPMELGTDNARVCPNCTLRRYPRISPAVIMAVVRDEKLLLAHAVRHPTGFHSVLAGFSEPGETLEETVAREVAEEVGLQVKNIRYFGSQPWPFPDSLMIGFTCEYAGGDIVLEDEEISEAAWYSRADLEAGKVFTPPAAISIAGELIDWFKAAN